MAAGVGRIDPRVAVWEVTTRKLGVPSSLCPGTAASEKGNELSIDRIARVSRRWASVTVIAAVALAAAMSIVPASASADPPGISQSEVSAGFYTNGSGTGDLFTDWPGAPGLLWTQSFPIINFSDDPSQDPRTGLASVPRRTVRHTALHGRRLAEPALQHELQRHRGGEQQRNTAGGRGHVAKPRHRSHQFHGGGDGHAARLSSRVLQTLRSRAGGRFRTRGRYTAGTVLGTQWTTTDRCDGTQIAVQLHSVLVSDLVKHITVLVKAGRSYLARPRK
jgi:hypothetical protein